MLKKFTTLCSIFFFNYVFITDLKNNECHMTGTNGLITKIDPNVATEIMGHQVVKYYKNMYVEKIIDKNDFINKNTKFIIENDCDLKLKTIIVGANTFHLPKFPPLELFGHLKAHVPINPNSKITFLGTQKVSLNTLTEQYVVDSIFSKYNLKGYIYSNRIGMNLSEEERKIVGQKHPDCSFSYDNQETIYYDVKQSVLLPKTINNIIPITFNNNNEQISGMTHYTNIELYLIEKYKTYSLLLEQGNYSIATKRLFDSFDNSAHLTLVERLDLSNKLTLSLLSDNKNFSGEIVCILEPEPSIEPKDKFRGNFDSFWKNYRENLPSPSESEKNAVVFRQFVQDNMSELMPLFKQQEKLYWPPFIDTLL